MPKKMQHLGDKMQYGICVSALSDGTLQPGANFKKRHLLYWC